MSITNMPSNVINVQPKHRLPTTDSKFNVIDKATGKSVYGKPTRWHVFDKAYALDKQNPGSVEVTMWDDSVGKHRPVHEVLTKFDEEHGLPEGDWRGIVASRKEKRGQAQQKNSVAVDNEAIRILNRIEATAKNAAFDIRKHHMTNLDMFRVSEMLRQAYDYISSKIDDNDPELRDVEDVEI